MKGEHQHTDAMGILFWSLLVLAVAIGYAVISAQGRSHRTITLQSLNYFSRPHDGEVRMDPIEGRAAWLGGALEPQDWMVTLTDQDAEDLDLEIQRLDKSGKSIDQLRRSDLQYSNRFIAKVDSWRNELNPRRHDGLCFVVVRGVPTHRWTEHQSELFFWSLGQLLGIPGAQSGRGELLGHVRNEYHGQNTTGLHERQYRTNEDIFFHCDAADVVGLLCLTPAQKGGASRIASSVTIYNEMLKRRPDLIPRFYEDFYLDTRGDGGTRHVPIRPVSYYKGDLKTFWHTGYYRSVWDYDFMPEIDPTTLEAIKVYDEIANDPAIQLTMQFQPGDIQLLSNHYIVHARGPFEDQDDPKLRRHLLRLWLSLENREKDSREVLLKEVDRVKLLSKLIALRLRNLASKLGLRLSPL